MLYVGKYCGTFAANMMLKASNGCRRHNRSDRGECIGGTMFDEEATLWCDNYNECCVKGCDPMELGYEEC